MYYSTYNVQNVHVQYMYIILYRVCTVHVQYSSKLSEHTHGTRRPSTRGTLRGERFIQDRLAFIKCVGLRGTEVPRA